MIIDLLRTDLWRLRKDIKMVLFHILVMVIACGMALRVVIKAIPGMIYLWRTNKTDKLCMEAKSEFYRMNNDYYRR